MVKKFELKLSVSQNITKSYGVTLVNTCTVHVPSSHSVNLAIGGKSLKDSIHINPEAWNLAIAV